MVISHLQRKRWKSQIKNTAAMLFLQSEFALLGMYSGWYVDSNGSQDSPEIIYFQLQLC